MGNYLVTVTRYNVVNIPSNISPTTYNWICIHSQESSLSIVEVERLWTRFLQLGAKEINGIWKNEEALKSNKRIAKLEFLRYVMQHLIESRKQELSFCEFLNAIYWLKTSSTHDKIKAGFSLINKGQIVTPDALKQFLMLFMPHKSTSTLESLVKEMVEHFNKKDPKMKNKITEEAFIEFIESNVDSSEIDKAFNINIMNISYSKKDIKPKEDIKEDHVALSKSNELDKIPTNTSIPTDKQLEAITKMIVEEIEMLQNTRSVSINDKSYGNKIYQKLASILGILQYDVAHLETIHRGNRYSTVLSILREWKLKEGSRAFTSVLKRALFLSELTGVVNKIEFS